MVIIRQTEIEADTVSINMNAEGRQRQNWAGVSMKKCSGNKKSIYLGHIVKQSGTLTGTVLNM